jgi:pimeloyl-ACP methyl ester carboxylesterase
MMLSRIVFNSKKLCYTKKGEGECLLLLHGFCEDSSMWDSFKMPFLDNYTVICPDLPGFGNSEAFDEVSMEIMASCINEILEKEGIEKCIFVGHSMGGYVAMAFAELFPEKLAGLCLFHSHPFADTEDKKENRRKTIEFMKRWGSEPFVSELIPKLFLKDFAQRNPDLVSTMISKAEKYPQKGIIAATNAMIERSDRSNLIKSLECPILFIIGVFDEAIPAAFSMAQQNLRTDAISYTLNVAHMGMFEAEAETQKILSEFITKIKH